MKLFFIRHGQTDWNLDGKLQGSRDIELNDNGIIQAEELSKKVLENKYRFSRIYSSPLKRAMKTAEILSEAVHAELIPMKGLEEINFGKWEGLALEEVKEKYPAEFNEWFRNRRYTKSPEGESYQELLDRVLRVIHKILSVESKDVAVVTHGGVITSLQCYLTGTPFNEMTKFKVGNTSIIEFDSDLFIAVHE